MTEPMPRKDKPVLRTLLANMPFSVASVTLTTWVALFIDDIGVSACYSPLQLALARNLKECWVDGLRMR